MNKYKVDGHEILSFQNEREVASNISNVDLDIEYIGFQLV